MCINEDRMISTPGSLIHLVSMCMMDREMSMLLDFLLFGNSISDSKKCANRSRKYHLGYLSIGQPTYQITVQWRHACRI